MSEDSNTSTVPDSTVDVSKMAEKKSEPTWTRRQKIVLDVLAVLGLVNMLAYLISQNSYVVANITWVYGIATLVDMIGLLGMGFAYDDWSKKHYHKSLPKRFKNAFILMGSWLMTIPIAAFAYYNPVIAVDWMTIGWYAWGTSLVFGGAYDVLYVMTVLGLYLTKGMEI